MRAFQNSEFEKYKTEAQEKWGETSAYKEYVEKSKNYSNDKSNNLADGLNVILAEFSVFMKNGEESVSVGVQNQVKILQNYITENYYHCSNEILSGLGQMYVADERFKNNIDKHADGTAQFISDAIEFYVSNKIK